MDGYYLSRGVLLNRYSPEFSNDTYAKFFARTNVDYLVDTLQKLLKKWLIENCLNPEAYGIDKNYVIPTMETIYSYIYRSPDEMNSLVINKCLSQMIVFISEKENLKSYDEDIITGPQSRINTIGGIYGPPGTRPSGMYVGANTYGGTPE